ncbi:SNF2 family N-terminal domain-containing protein [Hypoxylon sp. FL1857]|nr:SNF2 family N-terminal domain-containing protein [Hypoxylon sp. FL1857]
MDGASSKRTSPFTSSESVAIDPKRIRLQDKAVVLDPVDTLHGERLLDPGYEFSEPNPEYFLPTNAHWLVPIDHNIVGISNSQAHIRAPISYENRPTPLRLLSESVETTSPGWPINRNLTNQKRNIGALTAENNGPISIPPLGNLDSNGYANDHVPDFHPVDNMTHQYGDYEMDPFSGLDNPASNHVTVSSYHSPVTGTPIEDDSGMSGMSLTPLSNILSTTHDEYQTRESSSSALQLTSNHTVEADQPMEEPMEVDVEMVCFGMICESNAQLLQDVRLVEESGLLSTKFRKKDEHLLRYTIQRGNVIFLQLVEFKDIAVLDIATANALRGLVAIQGCEVDVFVHGKQLSSVIDEYKAGKKHVEFAIKLVVYGPRETRNEVGRLLSNAELYLQHTSITRPEVTDHDNPHVLHIGEFAQISTPPTASMRHNTEEGLEIETLLGDLNHQNELEESIRNRLVKSELKSHQAFAVDFIAQREGRKPLLLPSLWREGQRNGVPCYAHTITGDMKLVAECETVGGILADEMGLGKTLTMLASIVDSLRESRAFTVTKHSTSKLNVRGTLVIVPSAFLIDEWLSDIHDHLLSGELHVLKHHGSTKARSAEELLQYDIVLSTYSTVASDFRSEEPVLYDVNWFRVVLDEAHCIRHQGIQQSGAVMNLSARYRWCLTGTPIHNSLNDLGSLVSFLQVPSLHKRVPFRAHIANLVEKSETRGIDNLRQLLRSVCLRRTKELIGLADPEETIHQVELSLEESSLYKEAGLEARARILQDVCESANSKTLNIILQTITRLRRICNHGTMDEELRQPLVDGVRSAEEDTATETLGLKDNMCCLKCPCDIDTISDEPGIATGRFTPCKHLLCSDCYIEWEEETKPAKGGRKSRCRLCQGPRPKARAKGRKEVNGRKVINLTGHSSKITHLLEDIRQRREKCIVFSSWTRTLDIVAQVFNREGIRFSRIDGKLATGERRKILDNFQTDGNILILLMSLGTGAVGLNITAATRVHILEPQWNPSIEKQAIGRALRLGQTKTVTVVKYIVRGSIEEHIRSQQARKLRLSRIGWADNNATQIGSVKNLEELDSIFGQLTQQ